MRRALIAALALTALMPLQALGGTVTVRPGDTLSDIADRYGVSVGTLMRLNDLRDSNHVEVGQRLRLPGPTVTAGKGRHLVVSGDSLSTIASRYRVSERDLMALNNLVDADHVELGQRLRLPSNAVLPQPKPKAVAKAKPVPIKADPKATSHTVARGQTLTQIARAYEVSVASLVDLNSIGDPNKVEVGTKLLLRRSIADQKPVLATQSVIEPAQNRPQPEADPTGSNPAEASSQNPATTQPQPSTSSTTRPTEATGSQPKSSVKPKAVKTTVVAKASAKPAASVAPKTADWRSYGPLKVDWGNWQTMAGSEVAPTLNGDGQPMYLAINCGAQKLNVTGANGAWKTWNSPQNSYEQDLVKDRCSSKTN